MDVPMQLPNGQVRWMRLHARPRRLPDGRTIWDGVQIDITERKKIESSLRESEDRFCTMANTILQLAWIAYPDGYTYWYNERWYSYTGTILEQMEGWGWQSVHDPVMLPKVLEQWKVSIATGHMFGMEFPLHGADGIFRPFRKRVLPLKDAAGSILQWFGTYTDISERKREDDERKRLMYVIQQERNKLAVLIDSITDEVWFADSQKNVTFINPSGRLKFNIRDDEVVNVEKLASNLEVYDPDSSLRLVEKAPALRALNGEIVKNQGEIIRMPINGELRYRQVNVSPVRDQKGNIIGSIVVVRDVTEIKEAEKALLESEASRKVTEAIMVERQLFLDMLETLPIMICLLTSDYRVTFVNRNYREHFDDSVGLYCYEYSFGFINQCEFCESYKVLATRKPHHWEYNGMDGRVVDTYDFPFTDVDGSLMILKMDIDITEHRKAENALRKSEARLCQFYDSGMFGVFYYYLDGSITEANDKFLEIIGYTQEDLQARLIKWDKMTPREYCSVDEYAITKLKAKGIATPYEKEYIRKDGSRIPIFLGAAITDDACNEGIAFVLDVTDRKRAEEMLKLKLVELTRSNEELEQFAYVSSHDLQEPLRMITSYLQLLQRKYQGNLDDKADKYIHFAVDGAFRMQNLINDILEYSRVTRTSREPKFTNCKFVLNQALADLKMVITNNKATISYVTLPAIR
jgi:PAS domain S-box-containing protein